MNSVSQAIEVDMRNNPAIFDEGKGYVHRI